MNYKFSWNLSRDDWQRLVKTIGTKGEDLDDFNPYFGSVYVGSLCFELMHTLDSSDWYPYVSVYALDKDASYNITSAGAPYELLEDGPDLTLNSSDFGAFINDFESMVINYCNSNPKYKDYAMTDVNLSLWGCCG